MDNSSSITLHNNMKCDWKHLQLFNYDDEILGDRNRDENDDDCDDLYTDDDTILGKRNRDENDDDCDENDDDCDDLYTDDDSNDDDSSDDDGSNDDDDSSDDDSNVEESLRKVISYHIDNDDLHNMIKVCDIWKF